jgi:hypothetical protein
VGITGNINSSGFGTINNQVVVVTKNSYNDVYGAGLHLRSAAVICSSRTPRRASRSRSSRSTPTSSRQWETSANRTCTVGIDVGLRRYASLRPKLRAYGEGTIGIGFVDKTDVTLVAPGANLVTDPNDFYDQSAAFTFGVNVGLDVQSGKNIGYFGQLGIRYVSGMSEIDDLVGTGLDNINDKSARWTLPFVVGIKYRF